MNATRFSWLKRLLFAVLLLSLLAGCGGLGFKTAEPVELKFVFMDKAADYEPLAEEFNRQHPNITIKLTPVKQDRGAIDQLLSQAEDADAVRISIDQVQDSLSKNFLPIDTMASTSKAISQADLFTGAMDALKQNGKQVGLPAGLNPFVVYYIPKKFAAAGIDPPSPAWTLEEFVSTATAINKPDDELLNTDRFAWGYCTSPQMPDLALFTYLFGGGLFDSLGVISKPTLNREENVNALAWYAGLKNDLNVIPKSNQPRDLYQLIHGQRCGFWIDWLNLSLWGQDETVQAVPLPLPSYKASFNIALLDAYFIMAKSEHPEETFAWLSFLMQQESASGLLIPPVRSQIESPAYAARVPKPTLAVARSLPPDTVILGLEMYRNERFGMAIQLVSDAAAKVMSGDSNAQAALDEAQQKAMQGFQ